MTKEPTNLYKCESHTLDLACPGCIKAWISRHDRMRDFLVETIKHWECDPNDAKDLMKEIGLMVEGKVIHTEYIGKDKS